MSESISTTSVAAGEAIFGALAKLGVTHVFGMPGTQTVRLFEALRRSGLATVVPTHELAASFMAGAYYRVAGRPAVLITIPGPGFAYALPGLAEALLDSAALIHVVPAANEGPDARFALQAIPQTHLAQALAKAVLRVSHESQIEDAMRRAYELATSGEPGPVVVQLCEGPDGIACTAAATEPAAREPEHGLEHLLKRVESARRPVIYAGQGCNDSAEALRELAERWRAPVLTTTSARGVVPEDHALAMAFDTHRGTVGAVNELLDAADLVLVLGAHLGHNGTSGHNVRFPADRTVQVDTDPAALGRVCPLDACWHARVEILLALLAGRPMTTSAWDEGRLTSARSAIRTPLPRGAEPNIAGGHPAQFYGAFRAALPRDAVLVTDTGMHQVMTRRYVDIHSPRGLLIPSDFQSMGFGLPAAIAAKLAAPHRPVVALVGDGSIAMSGMELATAARLGLSLPILVFDDGQLNQIRLHQQSAFGSDFGVQVSAVDFEALSVAMGVGYREVTMDVEAAVSSSLLADGPTLIRVPVGDSVAVRKTRAVARAKRIVKSALGDGLVASLRGKR